MSERNDILNALKTAFESTSAVTVERGLQPFPLADWGKYPALFITEAGGEEPTNECASGVFQFEMLVTVVGYVCTPNDLEGTFNDFLDELYLLIYDGSLSLGANCRDCSIVSVNPIILGYEDKAYEFHLNLRIRYVRDLSGS